MMSSSKSTTISSTYYQNGSEGLIKTRKVDFNSTIDNNWFVHLDDGQRTTVAYTTSSLSTWLWTLVMAFAVLVAHSLETRNIINMQLDASKNRSISSFLELRLLMLVVVSTHQYFCPNNLSFYLLVN